MVKAFFQENASRFRQTETSPPMPSPLMDDLGFLAKTDMAEQVLDGTYDPPPEVNIYARELLMEMRRPEKV